MGFFEVFAAPLAGFYAIIPSYGLAIILLTITVRVLLLPLSIKQTRSMREMQRIQPEVKKIQAKYKGNRQKMNEEMMALYKEHGVNPLGGCLPLVMQLPVFIALYRVIRTPLAYMGYKSVGEGAALHWVVDTASKVPQAMQDSALAHGLLNNPLSVQRFLGIRLDCSPSAVLNQAPDGTPALLATCHQGLAAAIPYLALVLLMGFTTYYQQKQMQGTRGSTAGDPAAQQMQMMGKIMPVLLMVFSFSFPAGLTIYWLTTNVWTIGQQRMMLKVAPPPDTSGKKVAGGPPKKPGADGVAKKPTKGGTRPASKDAQAKGTTKGKPSTGKSTTPAGGEAGRNKKKR
jgi:YidC/Oxa1 family membrane protein insertase